jgi:hypothetical protein
VGFATIALCVASQRVSIVKRIFRYRFSPETFEYYLVSDLREKIPHLDGYVNSGGI